MKPLEAFKMKNFSNLHLICHAYATMFVDQVEATSFIAESGRLTFLYIWIPAADVNVVKSPGTVGRAKRSISQASSILSQHSTNIGVRFSNSNEVTVVPLSLADTPNSGLRLVRLLSGDQGAVFELQVRIPELECANDDNSACFLSQWQPIAVSADNNTGTAADFWNELPVACGSQCAAGAGSDSRCSVSCYRCIQLNHGLPLLRVLTKKH